MKKFLSVMLLTIAVIFVSNTQANAATRDERDFIGAAYEAKVVNCNEWISLRYHPSTYAERITKIPLGAIVTVYDGDVAGIDGFYPVEYHGMKGYCLKEYLQYYSGGGAPRY